MVCFIGARHHNILIPKGNSGQLGGEEVHKNVIWHGSSIEELETIKRFFGSDIHCEIAQDIPAFIPPYQKSYSDSNTLKVVFFSRIDRKKNLYGALDILKEVKIKVTFDIWGTIEDYTYWRECKKTITYIPDNITINYMGHIKHSDVVEMLRKYDLFLLVIYVLFEKYYDRQLKIKKAYFNPWV